MSKWLKLLSENLRGRRILPAPHHTAVVREPRYYTYNWTKRHGLGLRGIEV